MDWLLELSIFLFIRIKFIKDRLSVFSIITKELFLFSISC